ncbi:MAG: hypothetical protein O7B25_16390 [Gammaproteobacteria bacterium]|nr:hypothetical protein [Gammaproteobacteria bacterium]
MASPCPVRRVVCEYVNHPRGADLVDGKLIVSSIYEWFKEDFGDNDRGVIEHLKLYAAPDLARIFEDRMRLDGHSYDWSFNDYLRSAAEDQSGVETISCRQLDESA